MARKLLTERQWKQIAPLLPSKSSDPGRTGYDNRAALEGILWMMRTGAPRRGLPETFGKWGTIYQRFRRWTKAGVFDRIFETTKGLLDLRSVQVDGTFIKVYQHGTGAPKAVSGNSHGYCSWWRGLTPS